MVFRSAGCAARLVQRIDIERVGGGLVQRTLDGGQSQRGIAGDAARQLIDARLKLVGRHHLIEIADAQELLRVGGLGGEKELLGGSEAQTGDVAAHTARIVDDAEACGRHEHLHPGDADAEIAGQGHVGGAAVNAAVQRGDGGHAQRFEAIDHALEGVRVVIASAFLVVAQRAYVEARAEALACARQDHDPDRGIGVDAIEDLDQRREIVGLQPVVLARPVEKHKGTSIGDGEDGRC